MKFGVRGWCCGVTAIAGLLCMSLGRAAEPVPTAAGANGLDPARWVLAWSDEFNYTGLPDPAKWGYEEGFVRNHESQFYTHDRKENARVENGMLIIEGRKEHYKNPNYDPAAKHGLRSQEFAEYTAASLITRNKESWRYGRIEVLARLPQGKGVWPAIWTLGTDETTIGWPRCGEIDIMEFVGHDPTHIHGTVHYGKDGKHESSHEQITVHAPWDDFHVYAVEWSPSTIDWSFDGTKYHSFKVDEAGAGASNAFRKPHYLLLNLALGGDWGGAIDDRMMPQKFMIKYVRVYKQKGETVEAGK
jgi:beta-glucanase (GH16 family)